MTATDAAVRTDATAPVGTTLPVGIIGLGAHLPDRVVTNDDLAATLDTSDEWIRSRTGIAARRMAAPGEATSDLALPAARAALADAGLAASDLGTIVVATCTPDHALPGSAPLVAARLGVELPAFDLNAACSGFLYGLRVAGSMAATGAGPVLLIGAETLTRIVDHTDRGTAVLFGDGAAAVVLVADPAATLGPFDLGSDGSDPSMLWTEASGSRSPVTAERVAAGEQYLRMRGGDVYRHAVRRMTASSAAVLAAAGLEVTDVDLFVGHQANARILDAVAARLGLPDGTAHLTVADHGNTSAASVPLALADARAAGRLRTGDRVLLTAFGAGLTWGSALVTWTGPTTAKEPV
jgi:3-oxoacyl-[acyl-carrier-protein] synthase-3